MATLDPRITDETGHRYGRLAVLSYLDHESAQDGHAIWLCACDCGRQTKARGSRLRAGRIVSCGCERANPAVRQAARMKIPKRHRRAIARQAAAASVAARRGH